MAVEVKNCTCSGTPSAEYQDRVYGTGRRVFNTDEKNGGKCTCCGSPMSKGSVVIKKK